jgi:hypothetical protein
MSEGGGKRATDQWAVSTEECKASTEGVGESWGVDGEVGKGCKEVCIWQLECAPQEVSAHGRETQ